MKYEIALKLKEAGFSHPEQPAHFNEYTTWTLQHTRGMAFSKYQGNIIGKVFLDPGMTYTPSYVYIPTLSELIEACGDDFTGLLAPKKDIIENLLADIGRPDVKWCAHSEKLKIFMFGSTPDETVANLWLAINKK